MKKYKKNTTYVFVVLVALILRLVTDDFGCVIVVLCFVSPDVKLWTRETFVGFDGRRTVWALPSN